MSEKEFELLKLRLRSGNNQSLEVIFRDYQVYCIGRIMKQTSCDEDMAKDIFVDSVINFRDKVVSGKLENVSNLRGYIYTTCYNMYLAYYAKSSRQRAVAHEVKDFLYGNEQPDYLQELVTKSEEERLKQIGRESFATLGEVCKQILTFSIVQRLSMLEIAERLGYASADVIRTKKVRCLKQWTKAVELCKQKLSQ